MLQMRNPRESVVLCQSFQYIRKPLLKGLPSVEHTDPLLASLWGARLASRIVRSVFSTPKRQANPYPLNAGCMRSGHEKVGASAVVHAGARWVLFAPYGA